MNESIFNKIWNYTISVGQIITTFLIGCAVALVMWLFVQIFRPSKGLRQETAARAGWHDAVCADPADPDIRIHL